MISNVAFAQEYEVKGGTQKSQVPISDVGYTIDSFRIDVNVTREGKLEIKELIKVNFISQKRGIYRAIPYIYKFNGRKYTTDISRISVAGYKKLITNEGANKKIRIGDPDVYLTGKKSYDIGYTVDKAIIEYEDSQEIYWNLTGNAWDTRLQNVSFTLRLPDDLVIPSEHIKISTGEYGSSDAGAIFKQDGREISGFLPRDLNPSEGATIAVRLPKGYLKGLPRFEELKTTGLDKDKNKLWYLGIPIALWGLIWQYWRNRKNANKVRGSVEQKFYPPKGLTAAHVGAYIDHKVQTRDVISMIPFWATEGFIKVRGLQDGDMQLIRLKDLPAEFPKYEQDFFYAIFSSSDKINFSDAQNKYGPYVAKAKRALTKEIEAAGYYDASYVYLFKTWRWPIICLALVLGGIATLIFSAYVIFGIGLILMGIVSFGFVFFTAPLSEYGQQIHDHLKGLADFLEFGDDDEIQRLNKEDANYFSHMLPYAVAFGLDDKWMKTYETYYDTAPSWYEVYYMGQLMRPTFGNFRKGFEVKEMSKVFSSFPMPEISTGSGGSFSSGGGGFSGGGFGGGGGGSW